jgi:hypothetical protein
VAGPIVEIGNTNSPYRFACGVREFVNRWNSHGSAHYCAVGVGHIGDKIEKLGALLGLWKRCGFVELSYSPNTIRTRTVNGVSAGATTA